MSPSMMFASDSMPNVVAESQFVNVNVVNTNVNNMKKCTPSKKMYYCSHCNGQGHIKDRSYKKYGYPPNFKFKAGKPASGNIIFAGNILGDRSF